MPSSVLTLDVCSEEAKSSNIMYHS